MIRIGETLALVSIANESDRVLGDFPEINFKGELRPSQADVFKIAQEKIATGQRRLHIVAPPGSGKTVLGLYLWAQCIKRPALVLSPNSAIQSQWAARTDLFEIPPEISRPVSTNPKEPGLLTSVTYQSVTLPRRGDAGLDERALELWVDRLIEREQARDPEEAFVWIDDLRYNNTDYFENRLGLYRKQLRDEEARGGDAIKTLHQSSLNTLRRLKDNNVGLIILDECHHLLGHWGRVLAGVHEFLDEPFIIGLTATPPDQDGKHPDDVKRYKEYFGPFDYEVPVPAVVRDGFLAPYQDLAWFVRPTSDELHFIASADEQFDAIVEELCTPHPVPEPDSISQPDAAAKNATSEEIVHARQVVAQVSADASGTDTETVETTVDEKSAGDDDLDPFAPRTLPMPDWVENVLAELRLPTGWVNDWSAFKKRDPDFADAARIYLLQIGRELPKSIPEPSLEMEFSEVPRMKVLVPVLDRYIRHGLRRSPNPLDHELEREAVQRLRILGIQITDTGSQPCASPVGRVLAYSNSKAEALVPILQAEMSYLLETIRVVVVTDYEKTSAVTAEISHLLDEEAGGAMAAFKTILHDNKTNELDPVLLTGSSVLVDDDLSTKIFEASTIWLREEGFNVKLKSIERAGFCELRGEGGDWCPRVYVQMLTELFQRGVTRCLIGTRGLLGEGWDANKINVLVDLTTVTTSMTVNQLRGRSIRLDPQVPDKTPNNWDVVCIAPEFSRGLDDYGRFIRKHRTVFGVTDDGAIEKGVGHVHAAFTEMRPEGLEGSVAALNEDMLTRAGNRALAREQWKIGEPYHPEPVNTVEFKPAPETLATMPPFKEFKTPWSSQSLAMAVGETVLAALHETKQIKGAWPVNVSDRSGGYVRVFLENAPQEASALFSECLREALGPLNKPRYIVERHVDDVQDGLLSRLLPGALGRYFQKRERRLAMLHAVPAALAKKRETVDVYLKHWNRLVSPGEAMYTRKGRGEDLLESAHKNKIAPRGFVHEKEVFM